MPIETDNAGVAVCYRVTIRRKGTESVGSRVGDVLASKYRLEELLGSGGMGHVYRAVNVEIDRAVAIKVLRAEHATSPSIVERFLREARAANLVRHPNVVDVVDVGRDADGSPFIVQELLKGEDLATYVERRGGRLTLQEIEAYLVPVIDAVAEAHAKGVVHRDIKPENVFLAEQGRRRVPKLLDFGISKVRLPNIKATEVGVMMGTPAYMAPEQVQGSRDADPRTDVWALGIMLYELIAGRLPFDAEDAPALFVAIATKDVPRLLDVVPDVPPEISTITERCTRRMPAERYPSALELARDLRHVLDGEEVEPTQKHSVAPPAFGLESRPLAISDLVPDLELPGASDTRAKQPPAPKTLSGSPANLGLHATELSARPPPDLALGRRLELEAPSLSPTLLSADHAAGGAPALDLPAFGPPSSGRFVAAPAIPPPAPSQTSGCSQAPPPSRPSGHSQAPPPSLPSLPSGYPHAQQPVSAGRIASDQVLSGVMLAGSSTSSRRPSANPYLPASSRPAPPPDMTPLVALAVIGLTSIGATAVLMTFLYRPEGWPLVAMVTTPTPPVSLAVQGGLGLLGLILAGRSAVTGVKKWNGTVSGGRGSAVFSALLAGGFFFAALQLARAAW